jgi:hypothetical protein
LPLKIENLEIKLENKNLKMAAVIATFLCGGKKSEGFARAENMFDDQEKELKKILKVCKMLPEVTLSCGNENDAEVQECFDNTFARSDVNKKIDKKSLVIAINPRVDVVTEAETPLLDKLETEPEPVTILAEAQGKIHSALAQN